MPGHVVPMQTGGAYGVSPEKQGRLGLCSGKSHALTLQKAEASPSACCLSDKAVHRQDRTGSQLKSHSC